MYKEHQHSILKSFGYAIQGFRAAFIRGRNFRIQNGLGVLAIILALMVGLNPQEWVILILATAMVLILELINTAIEAIVDMISPEIRDIAKLAKDVSAASVLVASIASIFVGIFLFLPKLTH